MRFHILVVAKVVLQIVLLTLFMWYFGVPALNKYHDKKVMIVESRDSRGSIPAPLITFCRRNSILRKTWKNGTAVANICTDEENIAECIKSATFDQNETVTKAELGFEAKTLLSNPSFWTEDFTYTKYGRCYTLDVNENLTTDYKKHQIIFHLSKTELFPTIILNILENVLETDDSMNSTTANVTDDVYNNYDYYDSMNDNDDQKDNAYDIYVHDGNFILGNNAFGLPKLHKWVTKTTNNYITRFYMVEHHNRNLPASPCEEDPTYTISHCIKQSHSRQLGCRLPWDVSYGKEHVCTSLEEYRWNIGLLVRSEGGSRCLF